MQHFSEADIQLLATRSDACQLLAAFLELPNRALATALGDGSLAADLAAIANELGLPQEELAEPLALLAHCEGVDRDALLTDLRVDYTRMFSHPEHPAVGIYECLVAGEGRPLLFVSKAASDCERLYRLGGLEPAADNRESADHLGTQLQFLSVLFAQSHAHARARVRVYANTPAPAHAQAPHQMPHQTLGKTPRQTLNQTLGQVSEETIDKTLHHTLSLIAEFNRQHFQQWAAPFFTSVTAHAHTTAYRACGLAGRLFAGVLTAE